MIDIDTKLTIKHDVSSVFTDYTEEAVDMLRDEFSITLAAADKLMIGFRKPINVVYFAVKTANTNTSKISVKYNKRSVGFTDVGNSTDESKGMSRNGFLSWERNLEEEEKSTIDGTEQYWYEITVDADTTATELYGINLVFCDDNDLKDRVPYILNAKFLFDNRTDHLNACVAARNEIIQEIRDRQISKRGQSQGVKLKSDQWDILDTPQIKEVAMMYAFSLIFDNASDEADDIFADKAAKYEARYQVRMRDLVFDYDKDDDGKKDDSERQRPVKKQVMSR